MVDVTRVIENLEKAKDLLAKPNGYIKGRLYNRNQTAFCALGALNRVGANISVALRDGLYDYHCGSPELLALEAAIPSDWREGMKAGQIVDQSHHRAPDSLQGRIACYNNNTDQETVVGWFQRAIDMQREHPMEKA